MTDKKLKEDATKVWDLLMQAYSSANLKMYAEAWGDTLAAMEIYQGIVDNIACGYIVVKKGGEA